MSNAHVLRANAGKIARGPQTADAATLTDPPRIGKRHGLRKRSLQRGRADPRPVATLGRFPVVALLTAIGLAICSVTDALSRATLAPSTWFLWAGITVIVAPIVYRLCANDVSVGERVALVCLLGLALYAVKVMRDPFGFTIPDEFFHAYNAQQLVLHHVMFTSDSLLPVSARYPGLEGATSALMTLTGMSSFGAGTIVIAVARVVLMLGLLVLFFFISGSWRVASLGAAFYAGNSNFLLWSAQFSYESLSLPLLVVVLALIAQRARANEGEMRRWAVPIVMVIAAMVITHHLTSYLLDVLLIGLIIGPWLSRGRVASLKLRSFAVLSVVLTVGWLVVVASQTVGYITPVVGHAFSQTLKTVLGESAPHAPFTGSSGGTAVATPPAERIVAYGALVILLVALPFGLRATWRRHKRDALAVTFCLAALGFFAALGLRLAPSAWEIANRMAEFLFIGLGFVVAYAVVERLLAGRTRAFVPALVAILASAVVVGDAITGWPPDNVLAPPVRVLASGHPIDSETLAVGRWVGAHLRGGAFAANESDARTILVYGDGHVLTGGVANINSVLNDNTITSNQLKLLRLYHLRYLVVDRRLRAEDNSRGYAFSLHPPGGPSDTLLPAAVVQKFQRIHLTRIYDSGNVEIYDLTRAR